MDLIKRQTAGVWLTCVTAVLTLVALIIYGVNIGRTGYFQNASVSNLVLYLVLVIVMLAAAVVLANLPAKGVAGSLLELVEGLLRIVSPVLLALCLINLISSRVEGLGFIYFSNPDVILEVQTPANLASASGAIASMVFLGIAMVAAMIAAFFGFRKKNA